MGVQYQLVNLDSKECVSFAKINTGTKLRELAGTPVAGHIVTWYLLHHPGERISFIDDTTESFSLFGNQYIQADFHTYLDVTQSVVDQLVQAGVLQENGIVWIDESENLFFRNLRNAWFEDHNK